VAERFDAVVTLDFSAARIFQVLHDEATLRVLDFIRQPPALPERLHESSAGRRDPHRELVLPESIGRIELAGDEAGYREGSGRSVPAVSSAGTADPWVGKGSLRSSVGGGADCGSAVG
jgi:hypothetical protein